MAKAASKKLSIPRVVKTVAQIRFKPNLGVIGHILEAAGKLSGFPQWETDATSVNLHNNEDLASISASPLAISMDIDAKGDAPVPDATEDRLVSQILELTFHHLLIERATRCGFRRKYLIPVTFSFEDLVRIIDVKFLSQDNRLKKVLPGVIKDLMYRVDLSHDPYRSHLTIGPVTKEEFPRYLEFTRAHLGPINQETKFLEIAKSFPPVAMFIDVDFYRELEAGFTNNDARDCFAAGKQFCDALVEGLDGYSFGS